MSMNEGEITGERLKMIYRRVLYVQLRYHMERIIL
jgi:hypothetical protein